MSSLTVNYAFYSTNRNGENLTQMNAIDYYAKLGEANVYAY